MPDFADLGLQYREFGRAALLGVGLGAELHPVARGGQDDTRVFLRSSGVLAAVQKP